MMDKALRGGSAILLVISLGLSGCAPAGLALASFGLMGVSKNMEDHPRYNPRRDRLYFSTPHPKPATPTPAMPAPATPTPKTPSPDTLYAQGVHAFEDFEYDRAAALFSQVLREANGFLRAKALLMRGATQFQTGNSPEAEKDLREAVRLGVNPDPAYFNHRYLALAGVQP